MIVFGICIGPSGNFERVCRPSLPGDAVVLARRHQTSICSAYNSILDEAIRIPDLDAVALIHDDVELGPRFEEDVRDALSSGAGVIGAVGSLNPYSIAWWKGDNRGFLSEGKRTLDFGGGIHEVHAVDGLAMILSADCARSVRFDARSFPAFNGYDVDFCFQARQAGHQILVAPLNLIHHTSASLADVLAYRRADLTLQRKWKLTATPVWIIRRAKLAVVVLRSWGTRRASRSPLEGTNPSDVVEVPGQ
jgi:GT2 family glycosyltransferase